MSDQNEQPEEKQAEQESAGEQKEPAEAEKKAGNDEPAAPKKKSVGRKISCAILCLVGLVIVVLLALPLYSPLFKGTIVSKIEAKTGRKASLGAFRVSLFTSKVSLGDLTIKEEDGETDFVAVKKVYVNFSILPLVVGRIRVPLAEVDGVVVHVKVDAAGRGNFQSILDTLAAGKKPQPPEPPQPPKTKAPMSLPNVRAHVVLSDINVTYANARNDSDLALKGLGAECIVAGLQDIFYKSSCTGIDFSARKGAARSAGLAYSLDGTLSLAMQGGKPVVSSKGSLMLSGMRLDLADGPKLVDRAVSFKHDLGLDMAKGVLRIDSIDLSSDYLRGQVSGVHISGLDRFPKLAQAMKDAPDAAARREVLRGLQPASWTGSADAVMDLDRIKKDFGSFIAKRSKQKLEDFGGRIVFRAKLGPEGEGGLKADQRLALEGFHVSGQLTRMVDGKAETRPYTVALHELSQALDCAMDFKSFDLSGTQKMLVTASDGDKAPVTLVSFSKKSVCENLLGGKDSPFTIKEQTASFNVDLTALGRTLKDLMPPDTTLRGAIACNNKVHGKVGEGFVLTGDTDIRVEVASPRVPSLAPIVVTGRRDVIFDLNERMQPTRVLFRRMDMKSKNDRLVDFNMTGEMDVKAGEFKDLKLSLLSQLGDAQPYLDAFVPGMRLRGALTHEMAVTGNGTLVKLTGGGGLRGLFVSLPAKPGGAARKITLEDVAWRDDATIHLESKKPRRIEFPDDANAYFGLTQAMLSVRLKGTIDQIGQEPGKMKFDGFEISAKGDLAHIPAFILDAMRRKGRALVASGGFSDVLKLGGDLSALSIRNAFTWDGKLDLTVTASGQPSKRLVLDEGVKSDVALTVSGLNSNPRKLTIQFDPVPAGAALLHVSRGGETLLRAELSGAIEQTGKDVNISALALNATVNGAPLQGAIPIDFVAAGNDDLRDQLMRNLTLSGRATLSLKVDGSPQQSLRVDLAADATPFGVLLKNLEGELLINKSETVPATWKTSVTLTKVEGGNRVVINPIACKFADIELNGDLSLDENKNLAGADPKAAGAKLIIPRTKLDALQPVLPILKRMELNGAVVEFRVEDLAGNLNRKDLSGKLKMLFDVPYLSVPKLRAAMPSGGRAARPAAAPSGTAKAPAPSESARPGLAHLDAAMRKRIEKSVVDVQIRAGRIDLDELNQIRDLALVVDLNKLQQNSKLSMNLDAQVNPDEAARVGRLGLALQGNLSQEQPPFELKYDVVKLPYVVDLFEPIIKSIRRRVPLPLFDKMNFGDPKKISFGAVGTDKWVGIDPRAIRKSLVSTRTNTLSLPGGQFDMGFSRAGFLDPAALKKALEQGLKPLTDKLDALRTQKDGLARPSGELKSAVEKLRKAVEGIESKKKDALKLIDKLKPLAAFSSSTKKQLENVEKQIKAHDAALAEQKKPLAAKEGELANVNDKVASVQKNIDEQQGKLDAAKKGTGGKAGPANPFQFGFQSATISIDAVNKDPWAGAGGLGDVSQHPTTRLEFVKIDFEPKGKEIPTITGWVGLDGHYRFQLMPSPEAMADLEKTSPILASLIKKSKGVAWTPEGFEPNPLKGVTK